MFWVSFCFRSEIEKWLGWGWFYRRERLMFAFSFPGKGWEMYAEGQKLQSESSAFRKKLVPLPRHRLLSL